MSTYMSTTEAALRRACEQNLLEAWDPPNRSTAMRRAFFGLPDLIQAVGKWADELEVRRQEALAACSAFVDESAPLRLLFKLIGGRRAIAQLIVLRQSLAFG